MAVAKKSVKKTNLKKKPCPCGCGKPNCHCGCKDCNCKGECTNIVSAFNAFWCRGFTEWSGKSSRSEFWLAFLANILVYAAFGVAIFGALELDVALFKDIAVFSAFSIGLLLLYAVAAIIPSISMLTRRMHDAGLSAWFWLLYLFSFVPTIGSYIWCISVLVIGLLPTKSKK